MKKAASLSALVMGAMAAASSAHAAQNFTGTYLGASVGLRSESNDWTTTGLESTHIPPATFYGSPLSPSVSYDKSSVSGSLFGGADYSAGPKAIWGVELEVGAGNNDAGKALLPGASPTSATPTEIAGDHTSVKTTWDMAFRLRYGREVSPGLLLYGTGGAALQQVKVSISCDASVDYWCLTSRSGSADKTQGGWTLGAGVEKQLKNQWRLRADYRFSKFRDDDYAFAPGTIDEVDFTIKSSSNHIRLGLMKSF